LYGSDKYFLEITAVCFVSHFIKMVVISGKLCLYLIQRMYRFMSWWCSSFSVC